MMTLAGNYDFHAADEQYSSIELAAETQKHHLGSINCHIVELNDEFVLPSIEFASEHSFSPHSGVSTIDDMEDTTENSAAYHDNDDILARIDLAIENYAETYGDLVDVDVCSIVYSPLATGETLAAINNGVDYSDGKSRSQTNYAYGTSQNDHSDLQHTYSTLSPTETSGDYDIDEILVMSEDHKESPKFRITDYNHRDFRCGVITNRKLPCKNKISCTFHTNAQKSSVPRGYDLPILLENFKYLQDKHYELGRYDNRAASGTKRGFGEIESNDTPRAYRFKRHNSCDLTHSVGLSFALDQKLLSEKGEIDSVSTETGEIEEWLSAFLPTVDFASSLSHKLMMIPTDVEQRLDQFYKRYMLKASSIQNGKVETPVKSLL